jgi:hypothetical protein
VIQQEIPKVSTTTLPTFKLPHDPLTPLDPNEAPTPAAIHNLMAEVYSNAMAIQTDLGQSQLRESQNAFN